ncbi:MAG: YbaB/EbfC family nucleoid-associated protein [Eggerthellales bacterium]|nr:YbaB/EbfC family nucleoid-associated protein [Eggerthellales bacterium]
MAKRGGFIPGGGNMNNLMKQAQKMQKEMLAAQEEAKAMEFEASAGGGMVKAVVTGENVVKSLVIDPAAVDPEDVEILQDMIVAAVNEGLRSAQEATNARMGAITGGLGAGMGLPF